MARSSSQNKFGSKKEYTSAEILKNFTAVNEELKKNGFTYYQLPSMQLSQIWQDGKLTAYYPDSANTAYPAIVGPKGSITDPKNPNFDESLLRKFTDAKSLSDQYQANISTEVRGAMSKAADPSKVDVGAIIGQVNSRIDSPRGGGSGISLGKGSQGGDSSMKIQRGLEDQLRRGGAEDMPSLTIRAERINDADSIVAIRRAWGAMPASGDTGLDRNSDEYQYLSRKKGVDTQERMSAGAYRSTVAENETALKTAWTDFKSANDELKAKGYSYLEAKDGMFGKPVGQVGSYFDYTKKVEGPKGDINRIYGTTAEGVVVNPIGNPNSPQFDRSLKDLATKANSAGPHTIAGASGQLSQAQSFKDIQDRLVAKGVDLVKLEQDNPAGILATDNQVATFGAKAPTGQTNLPKTVNIDEEDDFIAKGAKAAKGIMGVQNRRRGGGDNMPANGANPTGQSTYDMSPGGANWATLQNSAMANGTWKPSDGYYFTAGPAGTLMYDPTGKMADNRITNPEKYKLATSEADGFRDKDGYARIVGTEVGDRGWLKDHGYNYQDLSGPDKEFSGPNGVFGAGMESDPVQKIATQKWIESRATGAGAYPVGGKPGDTLEGMAATTAAQSAGAVGLDPATVAVVAAANSNPIPGISQYSQSVQDQTKAQIAAGNISSPGDIAAFINGGFITTAPTYSVPAPSTASSYSPAPTDSRISAVNALNVSQDIKNKIILEFQSGNQDSVSNLVNWFSAGKAPSPAASGYGGSSANGNGSLACIPYPPVFTDSSTIPNHTVNNGFGGK